MLERNYKRRFVLIFSHCFLDEFMLMELANIPTARDSPDRWKYRLAPWSNRVWWRSGGLSRTVADFIWHKVRIVNRNLLPSGWSASVEGEKLPHLSTTESCVKLGFIHKIFTNFFLAREVLNMIRIFDCLFMEIPIEIRLGCCSEKIYKKIVSKRT